MGLGQELPLNLALGLTLGPKEGRQIPCILGGEAQSAALKLIIADTDEEPAQAQTYHLISPV